MHEASIGKQHDDSRQDAGSLTKQIAQEIWSAPKFEPLNKPSDRNLPDLKITDSSHVDQRSAEKSALAGTAKDRLVNKLETTFGKDMSDSLKEYMNTFEKKASANQLSKREVAETYNQVNRILSATGENPLTSELRHQVARETLRHCAEPEIISQGQHKTCNVTAIQVRAYSLHPSKAAKLVADVATTGEYTTPTGIHVKLDAQSMVPDKEARKSRPEKGDRDYATQLFNLAAVNVWYKAVKPDWHYEQRIEKDEKTHKEHVREQIVDHSGGKEKPVFYPGTKKPLDGPTLGADQIAFINDAIVGKHEPNAVLTWGSASSLLPGEKAQAAHAKDIVEESRFQSTLQDLKNKHQLPAIAAVETGVYPLNVDSGAAIFGNDNGGHVVNITDFTGGKNPHVSIDNEWSPKEDHPDNTVSLHDMYLCIGGADMARLDAACDKMDADSKHKSAPVAEITILAKDADAGVDSQFIKDAGQKIIGLAASEKALKGEERKKWFGQLSSLLGSTKPEDKTLLLDKIQASGACTPKELGWLVADSAKGIRYQKKMACHNNDAARQSACARATTRIAEFAIALPAEARKHYYSKLIEQD